MFLMQKKPDSFLKHTACEPAMCLSLMAAFWGAQISSRPAGHEREDPRTCAGHTHTALQGLPTPAWAGRGPPGLLPLCQLQAASGENFLKGKIKLIPGLGPFHRALVLWPRSLEHRK